MGESYNHYNWYYNHSGEDPDLPTNFVYRVGEFLNLKILRKIQHFVKRSSKNPE